MTPSAIERKYKKRATNILRGIQATLNEAAEETGDKRLEASEPWDYKDDELRISLAVGQEGDLIDITFEFCFSENWDGEKGGVNFSVNVVHEGGAIIGGLTPYNYSDQVWVPRKDADAVEERFRIIERADDNDMVSLIQGWLKRQDERLQPVIRMLKQSDLQKCPFFIFNPVHYREDGTCRCNDPEHEEMKGWGYVWDGQKWVADTCGFNDSLDGEHSFDCPNNPGAKSGETT